MDTIMNPVPPTIPSEVSPETAPAVRRHRLQPRTAARRLAAVETLLMNAASDTELAARLERSGFDQTRLADGATLRDAAQQAFLVRQQALGTQRDAVARFAAATLAARRTFGDFRIIARMLFRGNAEHTRLDLDAPMPAGVDEFISMARLTYHAALDTPALVNLLALHGFATDGMHNALAGLDAVATAQHEVDAARAAALQATQARQVAMNALDGWVYRLRTAGRVATRGRPDLRRQLDV